MRGALAALVLGNSRWWSALHARAHLSRSLAHSLKNPLTNQAAGRVSSVRASAFARTHGEVEFLRATWLHIRCAGARMETRGSSSLAS